ncbi:MULTISPECIES: type II toxin-antitoxin system RelE/ParE family toxin [Brucella]|uniref:Type II toxin-antitoxin system RelE/ParE family toxin n=1 Tax=Brucella pseudogrignonensis TaxID=419475 RepID=A0A7Y3T943_9HYPH|nr:MULTISPECIES: type II toxin-antitoxin system RelE/ParE family toxin [Brucella]MBO1027460.1 type II toxin-antitoxin system RelE/ParE family toxin [Ochrobactrum sp. SD129]MQP40518.1 type II toxin-antitoxin system mRNA interferase toxin, RelE/StbE family [Ochrobactrum sp. MYb237]MCM0753341.1 type II toxin-antitoxin system RelE/ParE family toxin [Brucella pseudogrignonensis]NNV23178.1 type II toxin-antitoxin system RelE/ParE family toxin [Brucella pseudogrignonensis]PQZ38907.1 type II toxin-ant
MKLTWSAFALSDRDAIFTFIEAENPSSAIMVDERIVAAARRLVDFPASGRVGRIAGTRELVINGTPYVAAYAVTQSAVRILRVLHGAREWPDMIPTS